MQLQAFQPHHVGSSKRSGGSVTSSSRTRVVCRAETLPLENAVVGRKKVVVLGGTGRVGSATAASLLENFQHYDITVASRSRESFNNILKLRPRLEGAHFAQCDINNLQSVKVT